MGIENLNPKILREISSERVEYLVQERKRLEIIQKQKDEEKRIEDTKRNFAGTNIVETLEEIRDKKILIDTQKKIIVPQKGFFRGSYTLHEKMEIHPMVISYNLDSVTARFDNSKSITISQKNNELKLTYDDNGDEENIFETSSVSPAEIIGDIAKIVEMNKQ